HTETIHGSSSAHRFPGPHGTWRRRAQPPLVGRGRAGNRAPSRNRDRAHVVRLWHQAEGQWHFRLASGGFELGSTCQFDRFSPRGRRDTPAASRLFWIETAEPPETHMSNTRRPPT